MREAADDTGRQSRFLEQPEEIVAAQRQIEQDEAFPGHLAEAHGGSASEAVVRGDEGEGWQLGQRHEVEVGRNIEVVGQHQREPAIPQTLEQLDLVPGHGLDGHSLMFRAKALQQLGHHEGVQGGEAADRERPRDARRYLAGRFFQFLGLPQQSPRLLQEAVTRTRE
jgi:hypothetical protein